jgi:hypothetical protein
MRVRAIRRGGRASAVLLAVVLGATAHGSVVNAAPGKWDHVANIKDAATRLAKLHKREGSQGVLKFLDACYKTHLLASDYTKGLESCLAQDYIHTRVLATIYSKLPADQRQRLGIPSPELIAGGLNQRFVQSFTQYKVTIADAEDFKKQVDTHGFPLFVKSVFPKGTPEPKVDGAPAGKAKTTGDGK